MAAAGAGSSTDPLHSEDLQAQFERSVKHQLLSGTSVTIVALAEEMQLSGAAELEALRRFLRSETESLVRTRNEPKPSARFLLACLLECLASSRVAEQRQRGAAAPVLC